MLDTCVFLQKTEGFHGGSAGSVWVSVVQTMACFEISSKRQQRSEVNTCYQWTRQRSNNIEKQQVRI